MCLIMLDAKLSDQHKTNKSRNVFINQEGRISQTYRQACCSTKEKRTLAIKDRSWFSNFLYFSCDGPNKVLFFLLVLLCLFVCFWGGLNEGQLTLLNFPKEASTRQKLTALQLLVNLFHVDLFSSSTWAGLAVKLLLKDTVLTLLCHVEEWEAPVLSNILSVS